MKCENCKKEIDTKKAGFGFKHGFLFCSKDCLISFERKNNIPTSKGCAFC